MQTVRDLCLDVELLTQAVTWLFMQHPNPEASVAAFRAQLELLSQMTRASEEEQLADLTASRVQRLLVVLESALPSAPGTGPSLMLVQKAEGTLPES